MSAENGRGVWMDTPKLRSAQPLGPSFYERAGAIIARYPTGQERSALLPLLYLAQAEHSFVSAQAIAEIAVLLGLTRAEVQAVSTFYTMFKREPTGPWLVGVCTQPSCALAGGRQIYDRLHEELGPGQVALEEVECLCACDGAPVFSINHENYERMGVDEAVELVKGLAAGNEPPVSARGAVPNDFARTNDEMAGKGAT